MREKIVDLKLVEAKFERIWNYTLNDFVEEFKFEIFFFSKSFQKSIAQLVLIARIYIDWQELFGCFFLANSYLLI